MSQSKLVKTIFQAGPDDKLIVKDIYDSSSSEVVNSYDKTEPEALDVLDPLNGKATEDPSATEPDALDSPLDAAEDLVSDDPFSELNPDTLSKDITVDEMLDRYGTNEENIAEALREMGAETADKFSLPKEMASNVVNTVKGVTKNISSAIPIKDVSRLTRMIDTISKGNYKAVLNDIGAQANLIGVLTNAASALRLPDSFSTIAANSGIDPRILTQAAVQGINASIGRGDIGVFTDVAKTSIAGNLKSVIPNIISKVITNAKRPKEISDQDLRSYYQTSRSSLKAVDPDWNKTSRAGTSVLNGNDIARNPFMMQCMRADVTSQPLNLYTSPSSSLGNYLDAETADLTIPAVFESIYGKSASVTERTKIINEWKADTERVEQRNNRTDDSFLLLMEGESSMSVEDSFSKDFPLLDVSINPSINSFTSDENDSSFFA